MNLKFKAENGFREVWKSQFSAENVNFKIQFIFLYFPLNLVDKWIYDYTWEDLSTSSIVVLDFVRKYLQKYFI